MHARGARSRLAGALDFNFDRPLTVVYPDDASVLELECAWTVFITLECATGRAADIFKASDLAKAGGGANRTVVLVTQEDKAKPSVRVEAGRLVIAGGREKEVAEASMDFVARFWKHAKDAGAREVGLVALPQGEAGGKMDLD